MKSSITVNKRQFVNVAVLVTLSLGFSLVVTHAQEAAAERPTSPSKQETSESSVIYGPLPIATVDATSVAKSASQTSARGSRKSRKERKPSPQQAAETASSPLSIESDRNEPAINLTSPSSENSGPESPLFVEIAANTVPVGVSSQLTQASESPTHDFFSTGFKAFGGVVLIIGFILLGSFVLRRALPQRFGVTSKRRLVRIIETVSLGEKRSLTLVKVGEETLLLGSTPEQIALLKAVELKEPFPEESLEVRAGSESRNEATVPPVKSLVPTLRKSLFRFKQSLARPRAKNQPSGTKNPTFTELLAEELNTTMTPLRADGFSRLAEIRKSLQAR